jgi:hypothetical protein
MVACMSRISMQTQMLDITPAREVNALPGRGRDTDLLLCTNKNNVS